MTYVIVDKNNLYPMTWILVKYKKKHEEYL